MAGKNGKAPKPVKSLADLTPDKANARRHSPRNVGIISTSLGEVGAARSIVIDEGGHILAGNATVEAAALAGIERIKVVDADGETIVALAVASPILFPALIATEVFSTLCLADDRLRPVKTCAANLTNEVTTAYQGFGKAREGTELTFLAMSRESFVAILALGSIGAALFSVN